VTDRPFARLLAHAGVVETVELRSSFGFMAFHGGNLERATDTIAVGAAEAAGASVYVVAQPEDLRWHIPSHQVSPEDSPALAAFLAHVDVAVALHGYGRHGRWTDILLGGANRDLAAHVRHHLAAGLPDFTVIDDLEQIPAELRGLHPRNPVNLPPGRGVQVELPPRVRGTTPHELPITPVIDALAAAATSYDGGDPLSSVVEPSSTGRPSTSNVPPARQ
jgi:phage replication-related protein YjqB (UPF0714/DUF867 family)